MDDIAIRAESVGKRYRIGGQRGRYKTLRESLVDVVRGPIRHLGSPASRSALLDGTIWALKGVSFEVRRGEVMGIIGRNGAGKSTLLKILARITEPTEGYVDIRGRVGSLLEVGTGFHPELTGRENIYLNGAILGMRRAEIERKFDEIVAFAEVEKFLDTPVKHYSSGMYVRLAFAVAAHLEPEILLVDEVLAVGDAAFQKKCLGKMGDVAKEGRTVLFVSHNLGAVQSLTTQSVLLDAGKLISVGKTDGVIQQYLSSSAGFSLEDTASLPRLSPQHGTKIRICRIEPQHETPVGFFFSQDLVFRITLSSRIQLAGLRFGATILDDIGNAVLSTFSPPDIDVVATDGVAYRLVIGDSRLAPGTYSLALSIGEGRQHEGRREFDVVRPGPAFAILSISQGSRSVFRWDRSWGPIAHCRSSISQVQ